MIASIYRETFKALIPNQSIYFLWLGFLLFFMAFMGVQDGTDVPGVTFLLVPMLYFALITGSMLTDMLVKPLSFCLPRQQHVLATTLVVYGCLYSLLSSLVYLFPNSGLNGSVTAYVSHLFLGITFFLIICTVLVLTTSIALIGLLGVCMLALGAGHFSAFTAAFVPGFAYIVERPLVCLFVLAVSFMVATVCLGKTRKRKLCGRHYLSFASSAYPAQAAEITRKIKREKLQKVASAQPQAMAIEGYLYQAPRYPANDPRFFLHELYRDSHRLEWKKLAGSLLIAIAVSVLLRNGNFPNIGLTFILPLIAVLPGFYELFRKNLSPLLPTGRGRHFKLSMLKGAVLYLVAIAIIVVELFVIKLIGWFTGEAVLPKLSPLPVRLVFFFVLLAPVVAWMLITLRSVLSMMLCFLLVVVGALYLTNGYLDNFLEWSSSVIALLTMLLYLPFVYKSYVDCFKRDLIRGNTKA